MSGKERCRRVGMSKSLGGRRSETMINLHFFTTGISSTFRLLEGVMAVEVLQIYEISGRGKNVSEKRVDFAIC